MPDISTSVLKQTKKGALDSQPQVIKFTNCLPMVGGSPASSTTKTGRHDIAENIVESGVKTQKIKIMLHNTCILLE